MLDNGETFSQQNIVFNSQQKAYATIQEQDTVKLSWKKNLPC